MFSENAMDTSIKRDDLNKFAKERYWYSNNKADKESLFCVYRVIRPF